MINFVEEPENVNVDYFQKYYDLHIEPMVDEDAKIKNRYHNRFWCFVWTILFLNSANALFVLFNSLMHKRPINFEQLMIIAVCSLIIMFWPIRSYKKLEKKDLFGKFVQFYGNWKHNQDSFSQVANSPILPQHITNINSHEASGEIDNIKIKLNDASYVGKMLGRTKTISSGIHISIHFQGSFAGTILLFDKSGFYRKKKFNAFEKINKNDIPAANYFNIFSDKPQEANEFLCSALFEVILDTKEIFLADKIYLKIENNEIEIFLEGSALYFDAYKFWGTNANREKFSLLHKQFEKMFLLAETANILMKE